MYPVPRRRINWIADVFAPLMTALAIVYGGVTLARLLGYL